MRLPGSGDVARLSSGGGLDRCGRGRLVLVLALADDGTEPIYGSAHDLEVLLGPGELALAAFAIVEAHGVFDGVDLLEDLGDRLPEIVFARPSGHTLKMGTKAVRFKVLASHRRDVYVFGGYHLALVGRVTWDYIGPKWNKAAGL